MITKNNILYDKNAFTILELSIVVVISAVLVVIGYAGKKSIELAKITNAINLTAQSDIKNNDNLVLWLETSIMNRENKENDDIKTWRDLSKNGITFKANSPYPNFKKDKSFSGIKGIYFDGLSYFQSDETLNLRKYTAFVVSKPDNTNNTPIFDSGILAKSNEISNNMIVAIKNNGSKKYIKRGNTSNFEEIANSDILNSRPSKFYIGNDGFKGEILEIIIFDKILNNKEIIKIENYLYDKYMR